MGVPPLGFLNCCRPKLYLQEGNDYDFAQKGMSVRGKNVIKE